MPLLAVPQAVGFGVKFPLLIESESFRGLGGEDRISSYVKESGFRSDFCSRCGSPVPNPLRSTRYVWVPSGLLDGGLPLEVGAHVCVGSKASWDAIPAEGTQFEHLPPDLTWLGQRCRGPPYSAIKAIPMMDNQTI
jgi:hypothetical protein